VGSFAPAQDDSGRIGPFSSRPLRMTATFEPISTAVH
jgi:hypothetical protein